MPSKPKKRAKLDGGMDWAAFTAMSDEDVVRRAHSDPDAQPLTEAQLARMKRATPVRRVRTALRMTQSEFAKAFHIPLATLRAWERGEVDLDAVTLAYLKAIAGASDAIRKALGHSEAA